MIHKFLINHVILTYVTLLSQTNIYIYIYVCVCVTLQSIDAWQSTEKQAWKYYRITKHIPEIDSIIYEHIPEIDSL